MTTMPDSSQTDLIYHAVGKLFHTGGSSAYGGGRSPVLDAEIALATGIDLHDIRRWLDLEDGRRFRVGRYGDTHTVEALL